MAKLAITGSESDATKTEIGSGTHALTNRLCKLELADRHLTVPAGPGHAAGLKESSLVAGMVAGADSISDMAVLRHGAMNRLFTGARNPKKRMFGQINPLSVDSMRSEQAQLEVAERAVLHLVSETFWDGARVELTVGQLNDHSIGPAIIDQPGTWETVADYDAFVDLVCATFPTRASSSP